MALGATKSLGFTIWELWKLDPSDGPTDWQTTIGNISSNFASLAKKNEQNRTRDILTFSPTCGSSSRNTGSFISHNATTAWFIYLSFKLQAPPPRFYVMNSLCPNPNLDYHNLNYIISVILVNLRKLHVSPQKTQNLWSSPLLS